MDESFRSSLLKIFPYNFTSWRTTRKSKTNEKQVQGSSCHFRANKALLTTTERRDTSKVVSSLSPKCLVKMCPVRNAIEEILKWIRGWSMILKYPFAITL